MNRNYPQQTKVTITGNGNENQAVFNLQFETDTDTPECIEQFLIMHGWTKIGQHPDTMEDLWQTNEGHAEYGYYKWEQAIAMQMFLFMNIGPRVVHK